jgi:hypothetical protein
LNNFYNHKNYNCTITTDDGQEYRIFSNWLHNNELDNWQGWVCAAGAERLHITAELDIYSAECRHDLLGNALKEFKILDHTVCTRLRCTGCTDDLAISKHNPLVTSS